MMLQSINGQNTRQVKPSCLVGSPFPEIKACSSAMQVPSDSIVSLLIGGCG